MIAVAVRSSGVAGWVAVLLLLLALAMLLVGAAQTLAADSAPAQLLAPFRWGPGVDTIGLG